MTQKFKIPRIDQKVDVSLKNFCLNLGNKDTFTVQQTNFWGNIAIVLIFPFLPISLIGLIGMTISEGFELKFLIALPFVLLLMVAALNLVKDAFIKRIITITQEDVTIITIHWNKRKTIWARPINEFKCLEIYKDQLDIARGWSLSRVSARLTHFKSSNNVPLFSFKTAREAKDELEIIQGRFSSLPIKFTDGNIKISKNEL